MQCRQCPHRRRYWLGSAKELTWTCGECKTQITKEDEVEMEVLQRWLMKVCNKEEPIAGKIDKK